MVPRASSSSEVSCSDLQALIVSGVAIPGRFTFEIDDVRLER